MKLLYLPLALALLQCATREKTGIVYAGRFEIINARATAEQWNSILLRHGFRKELQTLKIRKGRDFDTDQPYYYLFGETADNSFKMATLLSREKDFFYLAKNPVFVVCNSCLDGKPQRASNQWMCETVSEACEETVVAEQ